MVNFAGQQARTLDKKQKFLEAYVDQAHGIITIACRIAGIKSRKTVYNWIKGDPDFKRAIEDMNEIRKIVSLGLEARAKAGIKVRQPLQSLKVKSQKLFDIGFRGRVLGTFIK